MPLLLLIFKQTVALFYAKVKVIYKNPTLLFLGKSFTIKVDRKAALVKSYKWSYRFRSIEKPTFYVLRSVFRLKKQKKYGMVGLPI